MISLSLSVSFSLRLRKKCAHGVDIGVCAVEKAVKKQNYFVQYNNSGHEFVMLLWQHSAVRGLRRDVTGRCLT